MHTFPGSPTANTKGTKRSRTRTDSYTAGQSVGQFPTQAVTITMFHFLFNKGKIDFFNLWLCGVIYRGSWGNWPWRDHAQESRDHCARVDSLLQWVTCLFRLKWFDFVVLQLFRSALLILPSKYWALAVIMIAASHCAMVRQDTNLLWFPLAANRFGIDTASFVF